MYSILVALSSALSSALPPAVSPALFPALVSELAGFPEASTAAVSVPAPASSPGVEPARDLASGHPEDLHPALWRAHQLARPGASAVASGYAELDAHLPGGGWPSRVLTELLLPHPGVGELRLLAPVLAALQRQQRSLMWLDPPAAPCAWTLAALGIDLRHLVVVHSRGGVRGCARALLPSADILWALEQALRCGHLGALLAWLPARLPTDALRRLQLAAQAHDGPVFLLRDAQLRNRPSPAPLRLLLGAAGADRLRVTLLKRRGPPLAQPLTLALPPVLMAPFRSAFGVPPQGVAALRPGTAGSAAGTG